MHVCPHECVRLVTTMYGTEAAGIHIGMHACRRSEDHGSDGSFLDVCALSAGIGKTVRKTGYIKSRVANAHVCYAWYAARTGQG